jgi:tRNA U34 2-thiouridine synthase MnmA/TrmU
MFEIKFREKQRAITSGQICAIYLENELIMSGIIE